MQTNLWDANFLPDLVQKGDRWMSTPIWSTAQTFCGVSRLSFPYYYQKSYSWLGVNQYLGIKILKLSYSCSFPDQLWTVCRQLYQNSVPPRISRSSIAYGDKWLHSQSQQLGPWVNGGTASPIHDDPANSIHKLIDV